MSGVLSTRYLWHGIDVSTQICLEISSIYTMRLAVVVMKKKKTKKSLLLAADAWGFVDSVPMTWHLRFHSNLFGNILQLHAAISIGCNEEEEGDEVTVIGWRCLEICLHGTYDIAFISTQNLFGNILQLHVAISSACLKV